MRNLLIAITLFAMLGGCATFEPPNRPGAPLELPGDYSLYRENESGPDKWWFAFESDELNKLVAEALSNNFDIQTAWARLKQANAAARKAGAGLSPSLNVEGSAQQKWTQSQKTADANGSFTDEQTYGLGMAASYEVDLWGRLRSEKQAEELNLLAAKEDLDAAAVTIAASVVQNWIDIIVVRQKIAILKNQININKTLLDLQKLRFTNGKASALDVSQQRQALASAKSELPLLELSERQLFNSLALLLGKASAEGLEIKQSKPPKLVSPPKLGLPVDLLASRPDVRAAGLRLRSADWEVSAARADRLPSFKISAQAAFSSGVLDLLFNNWIATLAASITGPIFDGGRRKAEVERTRGVAEERLSQYAQIVAEAVKEVEDALIAEDKRRDYIILLEDQLHASNVTLKNALIQYQNGKSDYLSYLAAWTSVQNLELKLAGERGTRIKNRVALYRALGGSWTDSLASSNFANRPNEIQN